MRKTSRRWRAMNGSAGSSPSRNRRPEGSTSSGYARNSKKECAGHVAGPTALTAEISIGKGKLKHPWKETARINRLIEEDFEATGVSRSAK